MIATPVGRSGGPLFPVRCPACDRLLGSLYRDGLTLRAYAAPCTERCQTLSTYAARNPGWRDLPVHLRPVWLAAGVLYDATKTRPAHKP